VAVIYILLLGPQLARQDLRHDLGNLDLLKTYPLPGWQVLLGELLAPVAILSALVWLALLAMAMAFRAKLGASFAPGVLATGGGCIALTIPPLVMVQLLVPNAAAVMFPAWASSMRGRGNGGIDMMGQRLIVVFGQLLVLLLALLPAGLSGLVLIVAFQWLIGAGPAIALATVAVLVLLGGELWCGIWLLGQRFEKIDLAVELRS
ncbi:MAG: hypothetical protein WCL04_04990, partial [Verrucomicrobiota bacterium]